MAFSTNTASYLTCIIICVLVPTIRSDTDGVLSGTYDVADTFDENSCFQLIVEQSGTDIPADKFSYDGDICTGSAIQFKDDISDYPGAKLYLDKLFSGTINDSDKPLCGNQTFYTPEFFTFRLSNVPSQTILDKVSASLGIELDESTLEEDKEYIASSSCLWVRDGPDEESFNLFSCFPPTATVRLATGRTVPMSELRIGDRVQTGPSAYSTVFSWTHKSPQVEAEFVRLHTTLTDPLVLTPSHYVYNAGGQLVVARSVKIGDTLVGADGANLIVRYVDRVRMNGLYNPQTMDGDIVVDGVRVSTYTQAVMPTAAHAFLAPVRAVSRLFSNPTFLSL